MTDLAIPPWQPAPPDWTLATGDVLVFRLDLSGTPTNDDTALLSDDERSRSNQFRFDQHRHRWIVGRTAIRRLLAHATNTAPSQVPITYTPHGKPHLPDHPIHFNVSHSQDLALIALARHAPVGIDVELFNDSPDPPDLPTIARRFFTPAEQSHLTSGPPDSLPMRFYQCWTRKEALLKSRGQGLLHPLESFDVSPTLASPVSTIAFPNLAATSSFLFIELRPTPTSIAALVTDSPVNSVRLFHLA